MLDLSTLHKCGSLFAYFAYVYTEKVVNM